MLREVPHEYQIGGFDPTCIWCHLTKMETEMTPVPDHCAMRAALDPALPKPANPAADFSIAVAFAVGSILLAGIGVGILIGMML